MLKLCFLISKPIGVDWRVDLETCRATAADQEPVCCHGVFDTGVCRELRLTSSAPQHLWIAPHVAVNTLRAQTSGVGLLNAEALLPDFKADWS